MSVFLWTQHLRGLVKKHHAAEACARHLGDSGWESYLTGTGLFTSNSRDSWFEAQRTWTWQLPITFSWPVNHPERAFCPALFDVFTFREPRLADADGLPCSQGGDLNDRYDLYCFQFDLGLWTTPDSFLTVYTSRKEHIEIALVSFRRFHFLYNNIYCSIEGTLNIDLGTS